MYLPTFSEDTCQLLLHCTVMAREIWRIFFCLFGVHWECPIKSRKLQELGSVEGHKIHLEVMADDTILHFWFVLFSPLKVFFGTHPGFPMAKQGTLLSSKTVVLFPLKISMHLYLVDNFTYDFHLLLCLQ